MTVNYAFYYCLCAPLSLFAQRSCPTARGPVKEAPIDPRSRPPISHNITMVNNVTTVGYGCMKMIVHGNTR